MKWCMHNESAIVKPHPKDNRHPKPGENGMQGKRKEIREIEEYRKNGRIGSLRD